MPRRLTVNWRRPKRDRMYLRRSLGWMVRKGSLIPGQPNRPNHLDPRWQLGEQDP